MDIKEAFEIFTSKFGHKVIARRQDEWRNSSEGWEYHALRHITYWFYKDSRNLTHAQVCKELESRSRHEILQEIMYAASGSKKPSSVTQKNELKATATQVTDEPPPLAPDGHDELSSQVAQICEITYREPIRLISWVIEKGDKKPFTALFRERRRGWYFQMLVTEENEKWHTKTRVFPSFLPLLEPDESTWVKLTKKATTEDWCALDQVFLNTLIFPGSEVILAGPDLIGEEVAHEAMVRFGLYVPDEDLLPALLFENRRLGMTLLSYFKHSDGFAKENLVMDNNAQISEVFKSLKNAQEKLEQKLAYYADTVFTHHLNFLRN